jgi:hypothetical protein
MTAAMVGNTIGQMIKSGKVAPEIAKFGNDVEHVFILAAKLKEKYGKDFERIPAGAIGMLTYFDRLNAGLQQFMAGARKFALPFISRSDLCALTREAAQVTGITYVMDSDQEEAREILQERPASRISPVEPQLISVMPATERPSRETSDSYSN